MSRTIRSDPSGSRGGICGHVSRPLGHKLRRYKIEERRSRRKRDRDLVRRGMDPEPVRHPWLD